ncbi:hypothetical protein RB4400 [Rhodopirellula baltica SH 1]|uniref:Uncharacterized protein n=1 Tax=Rhodopirellula baltica (strain DSM 10527 / NCIMB 13988 / SH1) TaxID=243090 RepID=Q7USN2_RHOBA|nr:hypothetical protein RB4400 [Rhodopirellula baltica SH 1]
MLSPCPSDDCGRCSPVRNTSCIRLALNNLKTREMREFRSEQNTVERGSHECVSDRKEV